MRADTQRVVVITGAASGIGAATAMRFARDGVGLALLDRNREGAERVAASARSAGARVVTTHEVDVTDEDTMQAVAAAVAAEHGRVDVLVNNAGISIHGTFEAHSTADFRRVMDVNLYGVVNGCRAFLPHLRAQKRAQIVNLSSLFGLVGVPDQSAYCASKFAVRGFSESLRHELAPAGIGVTSIHPGMIATQIVASMDVAEGETRDVRERVAARFAQQGASPDTVARAIHAAVAQNRARMTVTVEAWLLDHIARHAPRVSRGLVRLGARFAVGQ